MNDIRHFINIITEAYKHYPDSDTTPSRDYLLPKRPLGGFIPKVDPEFDEVIPDDLKDLASYLQLSDESVDDPEQALLRKEIKQILWTAVSRLKPNYARVLKLVFQGDKTLADIAKELRLSRAYVNYMLMLGLSRLKRDPAIRDLKRLISKDRHPTPVE